MNEMEEIIQQMESEASVKVLAAILLMGLAEDGVPDDKAQAAVILLLPAFVGMAQESYQNGYEMALGIGLKGNRCSN